jgi:hypothetical protein
LFAGEPPEDWRDLLAFKTGNLDEHGRPERFMLPTYMKDLNAYANAPLTTLGHKTHPLLSLIGDVIKNKDYYGTQIRSEDDNPLVQFSQATGYTVKQFVPFSIRGAQKGIERGGSAGAIAAPFIGVTPAPADVNKTKAEKLVSEYGADRTPQGARTQEETKRSDLKRKMYVALRKGEVEKAKNFFKEGKDDKILRPRDYIDTVKKARKSPLINSFSHLTYEQALRVMDVATPEEQRQLRPLLLRKKLNARRAGKDVEEVR